MPVISVRIDEELKKKMNRYKFVNWSEVIRREIEKVIQNMEGRNLAEALLLNEKIKKQSKGDTTIIIRAWRDGRYGSSSS